MRERRIAAKTLTSPGQLSVHRHRSSEPAGQEASTWIPGRAAPTPSRSPSSTPERADPASEVSEHAAPAPPTVDVSNGSKPPERPAAAGAVTVRWVAVNDEQRYRRLLYLIFSRAEESLRRGDERHGDSS